jgi:hypothetical protein
MTPTWWWLGFCGTGLDLKCLGAIAITADDLADAAKAVKAGRLWPEGGKCYGGKLTDAALKRIPKGLRGRLLTEAEVKRCGIRGTSMLWVEVPE